MADLVKRLRQPLADRSGAAVHPTWFLRLDPDIERCYGRADFVVDHYRAQIDQLREMLRAVKAEMEKMARPRLFPEVPDRRYLCFYPMSKRRGEQVNWFDLSSAERAGFMRGHGEIGRKYAGQVVQVIQGSVGLDDWEWGVTLFADDERSLQELMSLELPRMGHEVTVCPDGKSAIQALETAVFDAALTARENGGVWRAAVVAEPPPGNARVRDDDEALLGKEREFRLRSRKSFRIVRVDAPLPGRIGGNHVTRLEAPIVALPRDRYVIRSYSPMVTIGGGELLDVAPTKARRSPALTARLQILETGTPEAILEAHVQRVGGRGIRTAELRARTAFGPIGLTRATGVAILSANYLAKRLAAHYPVLYTGAQGLVAHECILDLRQITRDTGITVEDVAKRLIDYGFHAPTMSFPVAGTLMVEPTESESLVELNRFVAAMVAIKGEIAKVASGDWPREENPLVNAPHTAWCLTEKWAHPYTLAEAAYPDGVDSAAKYWPPVRRIDGAYGDRNLVCACPPVADYA
jgi:hypothetical protein